jgi:hypothetical protein
MECRRTSIISSHSIHRKSNSHARRPLPVRDGDWVMEDGSFIFNKLRFFAVFSLTSSAQSEKIIHRTREWV